MDKLFSPFWKLARQVLKRKARSGYVPPGHFYSPIPDLAEIRAVEHLLFGPPPRGLPGIDFREADQLRLLDMLEVYYPDLPFTDTRLEGRRYHYLNPSYSYSDVIFLFLMLRHLQPKKFIEIGSGFTSCATLDTIDMFFDHKPELTFIEPYPELLLSLISEADKQAVRLVKSRVQEVDVDIFEQLEANDILFIDSTHVSKVNSDVNYIFFEILPRLKSGVYVHVHDVFYPFEYPRDWIYEGRAWNEAYILRAFLQFNNHYRIVLMNTFLQMFHRERFVEHFPLCLRNTGGSIWLMKE